MKANEAPEKIYLNKHPFTGELHDKWLQNKLDDSDIEYTRTDAFIEKACVWIKEKWDDNYTMPIIIDSVIEDFQNFMKGE